MKKIIVTIFITFLSMNIQAMSVPSSLVSVKWLNDNLKNVVILDIRKSEKDFFKGHIPGAVFVNKSKIRVDKEINGKEIEGFLPDKAYFQKLLRSYGVNKDSAVVIYTKQHKYLNAKYPARLFWQFKAYGFNNVALLNGGYLKWLKTIKNVEKGTGKLIVKGNVNLGNLDKNTISDLSELKKAINNRDYLIADFRQIAYYLGSKTASYIPYSGHIPTAVTIPEDLFFNSDSTFISKNKIENIMKAFNIDTKKKIILYCNTGNHSALGWFILKELLNVKNVKNFDGSLIEWTAYKLPTKIYIIENF